MKGLSNMPEVIPNFESIELDLNIHLNDFKLYTLHYTAGLNVSSSEGMDL